MPVYIDISRCIGCRSCEVACQRVHGGSGHINVHFVGDSASVPIFCHHCEEASWHRPQPVHFSTSKAVRSPSLCKAPLKQPMEVRDDQS